MNTADWIGFLGVFGILLAYFLNITGVVKANNLLYLILNFFGAFLACLASVLLKYIPFIILEGIWTLVSGYFLINYFNKIKTNSSL